MQTADKVDEHRIIPAHAGQTARPCTSSADLTDHPRACGANSVIAIDAMVVPGSSPRMRGKLKHLGDLIDHRWIIPAHAGQTYRYGCGRHRQPDHPRACGANPVRTVPSLWASGSSPRMRGKQRAFIENTLKPRIIPAHAGQTDVARWSGNWRTDHPRACGANSALRPSNILQSGSSPRMRGKRRCQLSQMARDRIIPAHAGQTCGGRRGPACSADHPRACGANLNAYSCVLAARGSSPRMRGKQGNVHRMPAHWRIIPAHAGQTCSLLRVSAVLFSDHPRACGANSLRATSAFITSGSSPRMRGKRVTVTGGDTDSRIIPAHAGQTVP